MLSGATKIMMVVVALIIDIIQFILTFFAIGVIISPMITVVAQFMFWMWFKLNGVDYFGSRQLGYIVFGSIIEVIPILDALPGLTIEILLIFTTLKVKENVEQKVPGGKMLVAAANIKGGVRNPGNIKEAAQFVKNQENTRSFKETYRTFKVKNNSGIAQSKQDSSLEKAA